MSSSARKYRYQQLKSDSPSVIRMTLFSWLFRIIFFVLATASVVLGVSLFISETAGEQLLDIFKGMEQSNGMSPGDQQMLIKLAFLFIILGILFYLISFLSARLVKRGIYIIELEDLLEETMEKNEALEAAARKTGTANKKEDGPENKE